MDELKKNVEILAKEQNKSAIEVITDLQAAAAMLDDDEKLLGELCDLKMDYL